MTSPADSENTAVPFNISELPDSQKLDLIFEHVQYLTQTVSGLVAAMQSHPMGRMMLGRIPR